MRDTTNSKTPQEDSLVTADSNGDVEDILDAATSSLEQVGSIERLLHAVEAIDTPPLSICEHPEVRLSTQARHVETPPCMICQGTSARSRYSIEGVSEELVVCRTCGIGSIFPMPSLQRIRQFYPAEYYGSPAAKFEPLVEHGVRLGARMRVRSLVGGLPQGSRVLDIGCGRGVMLRALLDLGHEAHGVEISEDAASGVDERAEVHIAPDLADAGFAANSFDAVILWHVLEHLPRPDLTISELRRIIRPGGRLIIAVPNFASRQSKAMANHWFHLDLPRHLYHFTPDTLRQLLLRHEFECRSIQHFALLQNPFGWLQSWLNRHTDSPRNSLYSLLHRGGDHPDVQSLSWKQRAILKAGYHLGLPVAGLLSLFEAAMRSGGTIAVTAELSNLQTVDQLLPVGGLSEFQPAFG